MAHLSPSNIGVVFDCDGTLLDSMGFWHSYDDRLAALAGIELTPADRDTLTASTIYECAVFLHKKYGIGASPEDIVSMIDGDMYAFYMAEAVPKPGALELVQELSDLGVPMAVASSTPPRLLRVGLETTGFAPYMKAVVSVDDVQSSKRSPLVYDTAREALGTERARTWGVEDALYALETLKRAHYRTLAVFDSDIAGSPAQLEAQADVFVFSLEDISAEELVNKIEALAKERP